MQYFRNHELVKRFPISEAGVRKLIKRAQDGRADVRLVEHDGKAYIANTAENLQKLDEIIRSGKKHLTKRTHKIAIPTDGFYQLYGSAQVLDIINNIDVHREIPRQYNYFDGGADYWDDYAQRLYREEAPNLVNSTVRLLNVNMSYLDELLRKYKRVNVIDVGVGNAWPTRGLLAHLLETGKLNRYVAVDISAQMIAIAERYIKEWFGDRVLFEGSVRDISHDWFADVLAAGYQAAEAEEAVNLVLLLGGTPINFRQPEDVFKVIYNSMGRRDLLLYTTGVDAPVSRTVFSFNTGQVDQALPPQYKFIIDLLGIDESYYDVDLGFDERRMERYLRIRLKVALTIRFKFGDGERVIDLDKGESILVWRAKHQSTLSVLNQLSNVGFSLLAASHTDDYLHLMTITGIRTDRPPF